MGPRQKCLGNPAGLWALALTLDRFNGAETKMSRKSDNKCTLVLEYGNASMGPRQKCLGNYALMWSPAGRPLLQWGRDKNVSEIRFLSRMIWFGLYASMGPRQKCLGNDQLSWADLDELNASMGPRQKCLGNLPCMMLLCGLRTKGFNGAETKMSRKSRYRLVRWPRVHSFNGAETKMSRKSGTQPCRGSHDRRFNGAETKMSRKYLSRESQRRSGLCASMGPRQKCLGNIVYSPTFQFQGSASMGPRQKCLGN